MNQRYYKIFILFSILLFIPTAAFAQDSLNISAINQYYHNWQDGVYDVSVQGDYAYLACDTEGLRIVNIGESGAFYDVAQLVYDDARAVGVSGDHTYLCCSGEGIYVIDISNPESPHEVGFIGLNDYMNSICIDGDYAYISSHNGLAFIDISNPVSPQLLWHSTEIYEATDFEIHGNIAYASCNYQGMYEIDISDITSPQVLNTYQLDCGEYVTGASVSGNYAYLSCGWYGFQVVDLTSMEMVAQIDSLDYAFAVDVVGEYAYLTYGDPDCPLAIIDISDPLMPQTTAIYYPPGDIFKFKIIGDIAYIADLNHGLRLVDISDPYDPFEAQIYSRYGKDLDVIISGNLAYVREDYKLKVIDITDLQNPAELGYYETDWSYNDLDVIGDVGYLTRHGYTCLFAVALSDPYSPSQLGAYTVPEGGDVHYRLGVYDHYGYLAENRGYRIVDLSDPTNIQDAGFYDTGFIGNTRIAIYDHYAFIQSSYMPLTVLDLSDPLEPSAVCSYDSDEDIRDMCFSNGTLFAISDHDLYIFDVTSFDQWMPLAEVTLFEPYEDCIEGIDIFNKNVYLTSYSFGLYVYDVTDRANPQQAGHYRTPGYAWGVAAKGDIAIVADNDNLGFYDCSDALVGIDNAEPAIPQSFALLPNYPNPFNASTRIQFEMPGAGHVTITVFDVLGRNISTLANRKFEAGTHSLIWDGTGRDGQTAASGRYYIQARTGGAIEKMPITLLK